MKESKTWRNIQERAAALPFHNGNTDGWGWTSDHGSNRNGRNVQKILICSHHVSAFDISAPHIHEPSHKLSLWWSKMCGTQPSIWKTEMLTATMALTSSSSELVTTNFGMFPPSGSVGIWWEHHPQKLGRVENRSAAQKGWYTTSEKLSLDLVVVSHL